MKIIIDKFEGDIAVVELPDGSMIDCPKVLLPEDAREGYIIRITTDKSATNEKLKKVTTKMNRLFKD